MAWHNLVLILTQERKKITLTLKGIIYSTMPILTYYYASFWKGLEGSANTIKFPQGGLIFMTFYYKLHIRDPCCDRAGIRKTIIKKVNMKTYILSMSHLYSWHMIPTYSFPSHIHCDKYIDIMGGNIPWIISKPNHKQKKNKSPGQINSLIFHYL